MSKQEANAPVSLSTMLGTGETFEAKGKTYTVKPITLKHIEDFMADNLSLGSQIFNITGKDAKQKVERWLSGYAFDSKGETHVVRKSYKRWMGYR